MKVFIIEDEQPAAERLKKLLIEIDSKINIVNISVSISSSVKWLQENEMPDLVIMDIHLADGPSFEIFRQISISAPVIFVTAYDQYALEAFKVNSIDYLLKPVKREELERALGKFNSRNALDVNQVQALLKQLGNSKPEFQKRIIIRYGDTIKMVDVADVAYFYTEDKINYLCIKDNIRYPIDQNLDELENMIDPSQFFRINRQFIINIKAIDKMIAWSKSRVKVILKPETTHDTIVSAERSPNFKDWLTGAK